jgi:hypothetical protein
VSLGWSSTTGFLRMRRTFHDLEPLVKPTRTGEPTDPFRASPTIQIGVCFGRTVAHPGGEGYVPLVSQVAGQPTATPVVTRWKIR